MEFTRRKIKGKSKEHYRCWKDETKSYRITWWDEAFGIDVDPKYYACVLSLNKPGGHELWDFCAHRRPYRTFSAAVDACELNKRTWDKVIELGQQSGRRLEKLHELEDRSWVGTAPNRGKILGGLPLWVIAVIDIRMIEFLFPEPKEKRKDLCIKDQIAHSPTLTTTAPTLSPETSVPSDTSTSILENIPALNATDGDGDMTLSQPSSNMTDTKPTRAKRARFATGPAKDPASPTKKPTTKPSKTGKKKSKTSTT